jgi:hypothetical protein
MCLAATQLQTALLMTGICHDSRLGFEASFVPWNCVSDTKYGANKS